MLVGCDTISLFTQTHHMSFVIGSSRLVSVEQARDIVTYIKSHFPNETDFASRQLAPPWTTTSAGPFYDGDATEWFEEWVRRLRRATASRPLFVGVFANQPVEEVNSIALEAGLDIIQLSGREGTQTPLF